MEFAAQGTHLSEDYNYAENMQVRFPLDVLVVPVVFCCTAGHCDTQ
jgi:hypothetical protein